MFAYTPPQENISIVISQEHFKTLKERLAKWDPSLPIAKLEVMNIRRVIWNNGALGYPQSGKYYTQALVPGLVILVHIDGIYIEVHTDERMDSIALPNVGFI